MQRPRRTLIYRTDARCSYLSRHNDITHPNLICDCSDPARNKRIHYTLSKLLRRFARATQRCDVRNKNRRAWVVELVSLPPLLHATFPLFHTRVRMNFFSAIPHSAVVCTRIHQVLPLPPSCGSRMYVRPQHVCIRRYLSRRAITK